MMKRLLIVAVVALAGCATYSERQEQEPWLAFTTDKSVQEFEGCAIPKVKDELPGLNGAPDGKGVVYTYAPAQGSVVFMTITLRPSATGGTDVELRSITQMGGYKRAGRAIESCK